MPKLDLIQEHADKVKSLLEDINNHMDIIQQHDGELKIWKSPLTNKWGVCKVSYNIQLGEI